MKSDPEVNEVKDNGEKNQWGKGLFFVKEGAKWTVKSKVTTWGLGLLGIALVILQLFAGGNETVQVAAAKAGIPVGQIETTETIALSKHEDSAGANKKKGVNFITYKGPQVVARPRGVKIPPGAMGQARLVSGASNGLVRAEMTDGLQSAGEILLEEGTVLVGQGMSTEERLFVSFSQAVFRDGTVADIQAQACDTSDKIVGLKGSKVGNKIVNIAGSIGLGFIGGFSEGLQDSRGQQGVMVRDPSLKNALLNGTATTAIEQSKNLMEDLKNKQPIIEIQAGSPICVIFSSSGTK